MRVVLSFALWIFSISPAWGVETALESSLEGIQKFASKIASATNEQVSIQIDSAGDEYQIQLNGRTAPCNSRDSLYIVYSLDLNPLSKSKNKSIPISPAQNEFSDLGKIFSYFGMRAQVDVMSSFGARIQKIAVPKCYFGADQ